MPTNQYTSFGTVLEQIMSLVIHTTYFVRFVAVPKDLFVKRGKRARYTSDVEELILYT